MAGRMLYVSLFKDRHYFPDYIKDSVFQDSNAYNPMDILGLQQSATERMMRWKAEGVTGVGVYLTGLTTAAIAVVNAAFVSQMYLKLFHYSYLTNTWLPQPIAAFNGINGYSNLLTDLEKHNWEHEVALRDTLTLSEYRTFLTHIKAFKDMQLRLKEYPAMPWNDLRNEFMNKNHLASRFVDLMHKHLYPNPKHPPERSFNDELRSAIKSGKFNAQLKKFKGGASRYGKYGNGYWGY